MNNSDLADRLTRAASGEPDENLLGTYVAVYGNEIGTLGARRRIARNWVPLDPCPPSRPFPVGYHETLERLAQKVQDLLHEHGWDPSWIHLELHAGAVGGHDHWKFHVSGARYDATEDEWITLVRQATRSNAVGDNQWTGVRGWANAVVPVNHPSRLHFESAHERIDLSKLLGL